MTATAPSRPAPGTARPAASHTVAVASHTVAVASHTVAMAEHALRQERVVASFIRMMAKSGPIGLGRNRSHLFRPRRRLRRRLDLSPLNHVLVIDPEARLAVVEGATTYDTLVAETIPRGFLPAVVPELRTITVGGAVAGIGVEATSFREGLVHDSVEEFDVLTGNAQVIPCSPDRHADLFRGLPNSYGTLGYALKLTLKLIPVLPLVRVAHVRYHDTAEFLDAMAKACADAGPAGSAGRDPGGAGPDFVDGVVFSAREQYLNLGTFASAGPNPSDYNGMQIYYRSLRERSEDWMTTRDYTWRWDRDWFWCSRHFGMENGLIRRFCPRCLKGSRGYGVMRRWAERLGLSPGPGQESVVQDIGFLPDAAEAFLAWFLEDVGITPIWVCPFTPRRFAPLFPLEPGRLHLDIAFWDSVPAGPEPGATNRRIETRTIELEGLKSLYARSYFEPGVFERLYGGEEWTRLKEHYDPGGYLGTRYAKCVSAPPASRRRAPAAAAG